MQEIKDAVMELLKSYPAKMRQIEQLKYELEHPTTIGEAEMIESLSFGSQTFDNEKGGKTNHISNKTMFIALQYQDNVERANNETVTAIMRELRFLKAEVGRLEHYISLLDKLQSKIIRLFYFENVTWLDMEKELHMSKRTLMHYRDEAVNALVLMYSYVHDFKGNAPTNNRS